MTSFNKILYLGAGKDIDCINYFPTCNEFIFIDTLPRSEHDIKNYFYEGFYRESFVEDITEEFKKNGFELTDNIELDSNYNINPHLLIFNNTRQIVKYYISTNILFNMNKMLEKDIYESDTLYINGYHPDIELLKYFGSRKINLVGDSDTLYYIDFEEDDNNIIKHLIHNNNNYNYYLLCREQSKIILCDSLKDLDNKRKNKGY
uniref:Uncharacterized protein n=1 Tax=viral metagenome TaxID=1070528 RepID=A0A6C0HU97_9ZZZZ